MVWLRPDTGAAADESRSHYQRVPIVCRPYLTKHSHSTSDGYGAGRFWTGDADTLFAPSGSHEAGQHTTQLSARRRLSAPLCGETICHGGRRCRGHAPRHSPWFQLWLAWRRHPVAGHPEGSWGGYRHRLVTGTYGLRKNP